MSARIPARKHQELRQSGSALWAVGAALIAALVLAPVASVAWMALFPTDNIWPHMMATTLPR